MSETSGEREQVRESCVQRAEEGALDPATGTDSSRSWIDAVNDLAVRQTRTLHRTLRTWAVLLAFSALALWAFVAFWWIENGVSLAFCFPISSGCVSYGCTCFPYWGARTMLLLWLLAAALPCLLVPRRAPQQVVNSAHDAGPYRTNASSETRRPEASAWLQLRRARRALIASATGALLVMCGCLDPFIAFPAGRYASWHPLIPKVNGVALLDLFLAATIVLAYNRAARKFEGGTLTHCNERRAQQADGADRSQPVHSKLD